MGSFGRTVLVGGIGARKLNRIPKLSENTAEVMTVTQFATTVHANILIRTIGRVGGQPVVKPIDRRCLAGEGAASNATAEMVGD
jgi:hypothetical protein